MKIKVTSDIISAANLLLIDDIYCRAPFCPVSLVLTQQSDFGGWHIGPNFDGKEEGRRIAVPQGDSTGRWILSEEVNYFLDSWENGEVVQPIEFEVPDNVAKLDITQLRSGE